MRQIPKRAEAIISLTIAGWNKSMFPPQKQPNIQNDLINCFVSKDGSVEDIGMAIQIMDIVEERRKELFPQPPKDHRGLRIGHFRWTPDTERLLSTNS